MSTETIEERDVLPMDGSVEVGGDIEEAADEELARAEEEGMLGVPLPVPGEHDGEAEAFTVAERLALGHLYDVQDRLDRAKEDHEAKADVAKTAKKRVETLQDDLSMAVRKLREAKTAGEPDPEKFPLFDKAKEEINQAFPKPEAIQPTAPDTFAEALRRRQRDTPLASMGLKPSTLKALEELGLTTALSLVDKFNEEAKYNRHPTTLRGVTEKRYGEVVEALGEITDAAESEWAVLHPGEDAEDVADGQEAISAEDDE